jgi:predicted  nucleic acid-binding Zn-ribbon protein
VDTVVARRVDLHTRQLLDDLRAADAAARAELDQLGSRVAWTENEMRRMSTHVAAVDERLAGVERSPAPARQVESEEHHEARALVDEVREEHARIRARLTAIARYEERIGRLEAALDRPVAEPSPSPQPAG